MNGRAIAVLAVLAVACIAWLAVMRFRSHSDYRVGEIYTVADKEGLRILKVLAADERAVHLRIYKNAYPSRPL